jgi:hypothetical protein
MGGTSRLSPRFLEEEPAKTGPTFSKTKCEKVGHPGNPCGWVVGVEGAPPAQFPHYYGRLLGAAGSAAGAALKTTALGTKVTRKSANSSSRIPE